MIKMLLAYFTLGIIIPTLPFNIQNGQVEDAVPVMANFNAIVAAVNANAAPITGTTLSLSPEDNLTAFAGGGQASATQMNGTRNSHRFTTVVSPGDSGKLPASTSGALHYVRNDGTSPMQLFGNGVETINGIATGTGIPLGIGMGAFFVCTTVGNWTCTPATIFLGEDNITAHAGGGSGSAFQLSTALNMHRIAVSATAGDSVKMPAATAGRVDFVRNDGSSTIAIFPGAGDQINSAGLGNSVTQQALGYGTWFICITKGKWVTTNLQDPGGGGVSFPLLAPTSGIQYSYSAFPGTGFGVQASTGFNLGFVGTLQALELGTSNTFVGYGYASTWSGATNCTSLGVSALASLTSGGSLVAIGSGALSSASTAGTTVAVGHQAGQGITNATATVLVGYRAGFNVVSGSNNVLIGPSVASGLTTGCADVVAIGAGTLTTGIAGLNAVVAIGSNTLNVCTGNNNTAVGAICLNGLTTGTGNTAVGYLVASSTVDTTNCTFIGYGCGGPVHGTNNTLLGFAATSSATTVSNEITLGNSSIATLRCQVALTVLSDARDKKDIVDIPLGLDFINLLRPVKFTWAMRDGGKVGVIEPGFIAQELQAVQRETNNSWMGLVYESNPDKLETTPAKLIPVLVKAVQELSARVRKLEANKINVS